MNPGEDLASLRRLDARLVRSGFRHQGRTAREWVAELAVHGRSRKQYPVEAHEALVAIGRGAVPALLELLGAPQLADAPRADSSIRENALATLLTLLPEPRCAVPVLLELASSPSARLRRQALQALVDARPHPSGLAMRRLLEACRDREDWKVRALGLDALAWMDGPLPEEGVREALARLSDGNRYVRRAALRVLSRRAALSEPELRALEEQAVLDDDNRPVVLQVLAGASPPRALPLLEATVRRLWGLPPDDKARLHEGLLALRVLAGRGAGARPALGLLRELHAQALTRGHGDPVAWPVCVQVEGVLDALVRGGPASHGPRLAAPGSPRLAERLEALVRPPAEGLAAWLGALGPLTLEEELRLALPLARQAADCWDAHSPENDGARSSVLALEQWVMDPSEPHRSAALEVGYHIPSQLLQTVLFHAAWCITYATLALGDTALRAQWAAHARHEGAPHLLGPCASSALRALTSGAHRTVDEVMEPSLLATPRSPAQAEALLLRALRDEVLPWARGEGDPVREVRRERRRWL